MASAARKIIDEMTELVPPGQVSVGFAEREELHRLTALLLEADAEGVAGYRRYMDIAHRQLDTSPREADLRAAYAGRRILVTGGTGCIGSELVRQLQRFEPAAIYVVYAMHDDFVPEPGVVYLHVDIADAVHTHATITEIDPDVVFHCAAQRSPWLAERQVLRTLRSNVLGTRNVLRAVRDVEPERFVHASTGKAMRYYTSDVYAATKKVAESLVADYAREGREAGLARFTHVVDNAVLLQRVDEALSSPDGVMRVHDPELWFYAQSARESAQLLLLAGLSHDTDRAPQAAAIRSLGEPAKLVDVVVGRIAEHRGNQDAAIYFSGSEKGYELSTAPGLYDPQTAVEVSPLINAIEAPGTHPMPGVESVDVFRPASPAGDIDTVVDDIERVTGRGRALDAANELARAGRDLAEWTFDTCSDDVLERLHTLAARGHGTLPTTKQPAAAKTWADRAAS